MESNSKSLEERVAELEDFKEKASVLFDICMGEWRDFKESLTDELNHAVRKAAKASDDRIAKKVAEAWGIDVERD